MNKFLTILRIINSIPLLIASAESIKNATGPDKANAVQQQVMEALMASELVAGRDVIDQQAFKRSLKKSVDGIVGMLNASAWKHTAK